MLTMMRTDTNTKIHKKHKNTKMTFLLLRYLLAASQLPLTSRATFVLDVLSSLALLISYFLSLFRYLVTLIRYLIHGLNQNTDFLLLFAGL